MEMGYNLFYSTIGLALDTICLMLPVLLLFNIEYRKRCDIYFIAFLIQTFLENVLLLNDTLKFILLISGVGYVSYKIAKIDFRYLFLFVLNFTIIFAFDYIGFVTFGGNENILFLVYSVLYKLLLIKYLRLSNKAKINDILKIQILTAFSQTILILLSLVVRGCL